MEKVTLNGESHGVALPGFAEREELALAYNAQLKLQAGSEEIRPQYFRVLCSAIGLCVPRIGRRLSDAGIIYEKCSADPLIYGGKIYDWFRKKGVPPAELARVGMDLLKALSESLAPTEEEVQAKANFTAPNAES